jgi:hypothetical protein
MKVLAPRELAQKLSESSEIPGGCGLEFTKSEKIEGAFEETIHVIE